MIELVTSVSSPSVKATNPSNQSYRFLGELPTGRTELALARAMKFDQGLDAEGGREANRSLDRRNTGRMKGVASMVAPPSRRVPLNVNKRPWTSIVKPSHGDRGFRLI
jgi:hypothetical protein